MSLSSSSLRHTQVWYYVALLTTQWMIGYVRSALCNDGGCMFICLVNFQTCEVSLQLHLHSCVLKVVLLTHISTFSGQAILSRPTVPGRQGVHPVNSDTFQQLMHLKFMRSLAAPGEAVGVIAAQSVGETPIKLLFAIARMQFLIKAPG